MKEHINPVLQHGDQERKLYLDRQVCALFWRHGDGAAPMVVDPAPDVGAQPLAIRVRDRLPGQFRQPMVASLAQRIGEIVFKQAHETLILRALLSRALGSAAERTCNAIKDQPIGKVVLAINPGTEGRFTQQQRIHP
ncbi:MAG: hypothetical protein RMM10_13535, partial [Anaerolineae bacterium]|uniref:hypothetical protein n=1 Tax=Thermoflexus sp. TaxID=1969742 RepID=UPI0025D14B2A